MIRKTLRDIINSINRLDKIKPKDPVIVCKKLGRHSYQLDSKSKEWICACGAKIQEPRKGGR